MGKNGEGGLTENKLASKAETRGIETVISVDNNVTQLFEISMGLIVPITVKPGPVFQVGFLFHGGFYLGF